MKDILNCKYQVRIESNVTQCMTLQEYRVYESEHSGVFHGVEGSILFGIAICALSILVLMIITTLNYLSDY